LKVSVPPNFLGLVLDRPHHRGYRHSALLHALALAKLPLNGPPRRASPWVGCSRRAADRHDRPQESRV
jgi:hypothetical protein